MEAKGYHESIHQYWRLNRLRRYNGKVPNNLYEHFICLAVLFNFFKFYFVENSNVLHVKVTLTEICCRYNILFPIFSAGRLQYFKHSNTCIGLNPNKLRTCDNECVCHAVSGRKK